MNHNCLIKIFFRQSRSQLLRTILLIFGIALGVSGVIAIDIAKTSVSRSFELSTAALTSRSTHQVVGSRLNISQSVFTDLRVVSGINKSAPVINANIKVLELNGKTMNLMGIDPFSEMHFRDIMLSRSGLGPVDFSALLNAPSGVLLSKRYASSYGLKRNDTLTLSLGTRQVKTVIAGFMDSRDDAVGMAFEGLILTDISIAQEILGMADSISRIDLILNDASVVKQIRKGLPDGVFLIETHRRNKVIRQLSTSFETSLTAFSMLALFMGIFLIYNTVSFSVTRRRKLNGILRALGATRTGIFSAVILEVMVYALAGSIIGIILGIFMGHGAVRAVCATVSDMYFVLTVSKIHITVSTVLKGLFAGLISSFAASVFPAANAAGTLPINLMQRSASENTLKRYIPLLTLSGVLVIGLAVLLLMVFKAGPGYDFIGIFMIFLGSSLLAPVFILKLLGGMVLVFKRMWGIVTHMAVRNISGSLSRTSVLIASLMVVTSVYIGIEIMTTSFRFSIDDWVDGHIGGDIHISSSDALNRRLDPELYADILKLPGVSSVSAYNIHRVLSRTSGEVHVFSYISDLSTKKWSWTAAHEDELDALLEQGWIFVSEIFAMRNKIEAGTGAQVVLDTQKGPVSFKIAGVFRDYFMGGGRVIVSRQTMKNFWGYDDITSMQLFVTQKEAIAPLMERINALIPDTARIKVISGSSIKKNILEVFDKTFIITSALQVLTAIVALTGILNSVMALLLERTGEMGVLRACGAEIRQVRRLLLTECGLCGFISGLMALPLGVCLSWVLIEIVNRRSFGWTYDMIVSPGICIDAVALACIAALIAGIFPALRAGKTDIGKAIHME